MNFIHRRNGYRIEKASGAKFVVWQCTQRGPCTEQDQGAKLPDGTVLAVCESCPLLAECRVGELEPVKLKKQGLLSRAASFVKAQAKTAFTGYASNEVIEQRLAICNACPHLIDNKCELCTCSIAREKGIMNKLSHKSTQCYDKPPRWGPVTPANQSSHSPE